MAKHYTDQEIKEQLKESLGEGTGGIFYLIQIEVCSLRIKFANFKALFGDSEETINLLNKSCQTFFGQLHVIMQDDINLSLSRILDQSKNTASIKHLIKSIKDKSLKSQLEVLERQIYDLTLANKSLRHSRLAHIDKNHRLNPQKTLVYMSRLDFKETLDKICEFLNCIRTHFGLTEMLYSILDTNKSANCLLYRLQDALKFEKLERGNFNNGH